LRHSRAELQRPRASSTLVPNLSTASAQLCAPRLRAAVRGAQRPPGPGNDKKPLRRGGAGATPSPSSRAGMRAIARAARRLAPLAQVPIRCAQTRAAGKRGRPCRVSTGDSQFRDFARNRLEGLHQSRLRCSPRRRSAALEAQLASRARVLASFSSLMRWCRRRCRRPWRSRRRRASCCLSAR
jgi:hypothetical protein